MLLAGAWGGSGAGPAEDAERSGPEASLGSGSKHRQRRGRGTCVQEEETLGQTLTQELWAQTRATRDRAANSVTRGE